MYLIYMNHIIINISYGPYDMGHMIFACLIKFLRFLRILLAVN